MTKSSSIQIRDLKTKSIILQPQEIEIIAKNVNQTQDKIENIDTEGDSIPIMECQKEGKPGFKYGADGTCYEYDPDDESSKKRAHDKAGKQGQAIEISKHADESSKLDNAFPNFHTARISDPDKYDSFATKELDDGILAVLGIKDNKSEIQAYRFDKKKFTAKEARKWLKDHDEKVIEFAEAKQGDAAYMISKLLNEWDGAAAAQSLFNYAEDEDGEIKKSKIAKYFGIVEGDGKKRGDYSYPLGKIVNGSPQYDRDGLVAAFVAASGAHTGVTHPGLAERIAKIMKREFPDEITEGMEKKVDQSFEIDKQLDGKPTYEYLYSVYETLLAHPMIWSQVKNDIHLHARGSAGGKLKGKNAKSKTEVQDIIGSEVSETRVEEDTNGSILLNEAPTGAILYPELPISMDAHATLAWLKKNNIPHIDIATIPMREGVWIGSDGIPTLKKFENIEKDAHWLEGVPIVNGHLYNQGVKEVMPDTPKLGQLLSVKVRPDKRDAIATSRIFTNSLTPEFLDGFLKGDPKHCSIEYRAKLNDESGEFEGKHYDRVESDYYFYNLSIVPQGACPVPHCGILLNESPKEGKIDYIKIINQAICPIKCKLDKLIEDRNIVIKKDKSKNVKK